MTQEQAAETLGISPNYVSNIETGRDICSTVVLLGMANLYHASAYQSIFGALGNASWKSSADVLPAFLPLPKAS